MGQDPNKRIESAVAEHGERLFRAARYLLGNEREAEDLCQAVFLELCRSIDRFEGRASLYTWLYRIMLNLYYRRLRRLRLERQSQADVAAADACDPPESMADAEHRDGRLREAIQELPRIYQTVIVLHYLENRSAVEIGAILALLAGTVRSRLHEARTLLRRRLQKEFPDGLCKQFRQSWEPGAGAPRSGMSARSCQDETHAGREGPALAVGGRSSTGAYAPLSRRPEAGERKSAHRPQAGRGGSPSSHASEPRRDRGRVSQEEAAADRRHGHTSRCEACRQWQAEQTAADQWLRAALPAVVEAPVAPTVTVRLHAALPQPLPPRPIVAEDGTPARRAAWPDVWGKIGYAAAAALTAAALLAAALRPGL